MLGLPAHVRACLFDLDGVLTETAKVHAAAWKEMLDAYLRARAGRSGEEFRPFDQDDYDTYVDGKPRYDGVRSFLTSRGVELPEGVPADPPAAETVCGLGNRKNEIVLRLIHENGVKAYAGSRRYQMGDRPLSACGKARVRQVDRGGATMPIRPVTSCGRGARTSGLRLRAVAHTRAISPSSRQSTRHCARPFDALSSVGCRSSPGAALSAAGR